MKIVNGKECAIVLLNLFKKKNKTSEVQTKIVSTNIKERKLSLEKSNEMNTTIRVFLGKISSVDTVEEKVAIAKEWLVNTDVIETEDTLCQFDDENWYKERNYLKKYLEYKKTKSSLYKGVDCDVSLLSVVTYVLLSEQLESENIINQYGSKLKYEIRNNGKRFKGDTLTSALHILKLYLGCLWKRIDNNEQLKREKKYKDFYVLFQTVARTGVPVAPTGNWNDYCYEHSDIIWRAMDESAKQFFTSYNMLGNYMRIPGNSYQISDKMWTSFNMSRSNKGKWDTVDTLLTKIYAYYKCVDKSYLSSIFTDKKDEITAETLGWLDEFDGWKDFVDKNCLSAFVDKQTMVPIVMKTGLPINRDELNGYDAIPKKHQEFLTFFEQVSERIVLRSKCISDKLACSQ